MNKQKRKKLLVLGSGSGIEIYKKDIQRLRQDESIEILTFSMGFMFCVNELGFHPDYHCFTDPTPFAPVWHYVKENVEKKKIETKFIFLDPIHTRGSYKDFQSFVGTTPLGRGNPHPDGMIWPGRSHTEKISPSLSWEMFLNATKKIIEHPDLNEVVIPCTSLKHIAANPDLYPQFKNKDLINKDFHLRFQGDKIILKSQLNPNLNEDKLTSGVLPVIQWLFKESSYIKEVGIIGFEMKGGRYMWNYDHRYVGFFQKLGFPGLHTGNPNFAFCYGNNRGLNEAEITSRTYLKLWNQHTDLTKLDLYSVVESKYSLLNKYIQYKAIENYGKFD